MEKGNFLKDYAKDNSSQFGEDGVVAKIFEILPKQDRYWSVEFGAWDGKLFSNTYNLITNCNWYGIFIEANKKKFLDLKKTYLNNTKVTLINSFVHFEGEDILDNILQETDIPLNFDLLSIDIDGNDYYVWDSIKKYNPKILLIEFNPTIPSDIEFVQPKNKNLNQGASLLSLIQLGKSKGYEIIATTHCNGFFVKNEYYKLFQISDNSISKIWETEIKAPRVFQLYDGTIVLTTKFNLAWSNITVNEYDLQKLPKYLRFYRDNASGIGFIKRGLKKIYKYFQIINT